MKLLMCGQEAGTHKDHQKALSYLALWQGSGHQTVPCRSTTIRKAAGKQSICKASAQLTSTHLDPCQRCFCVSGICVCLQHFTNTRRGSQAGQVIRGAGLSLGTILLHLPHTEWAKCRTIVPQMAYGMKCWFLEFLCSLIFIPPSQPQHHWDWFMHQAGSPN